MSIWSAFSKSRSFLGLVNSLLGHTLRELSNYFFSPTTTTILAGMLSRQVNKISSWRKSGFLGELPFLCCVSWSW